MMCRVVIFVRRLSLTSEILRMIYVANSKCRSMLLPMLP
jgi:hypothetical protein